MEQPRQIQIKQLWDKLEGLPSKMRREVAEMMKREPIYGLLGHQVMPSPEFLQQYTKQYIDMTKNAEKFMVSQSDIDYAREHVLAAAACTYGDDEARFRRAEAYILATWPFVERKMRRNPGYYWYCSDNGGWDSAFMPRFYTDIPGTVSPEEQKMLAPEHRSNTALQMDTAFGWYRDTSGVYRKIPLNDPAMRQCIQESIWSGVRFRVLVNNYYGKLVGEGARIVELCGGALQSLRRCGYLEENLHQKFVVYDSNPQIKDVLPIVFDRPIEDLGIEYRYLDYRKAADDPELQGKQHLVRIQGGASYFVPETVYNLRIVRSLLMSGAYGVLDLQLKDINLLKCQLTLEYNMPGAKMQPDDNVSSATRRIEGAVAEAGGLKIEDIISDESLNAPRQPTTVAVVLKAI